ncbi:hypothetical protein NQ315_011476 [Exocentrus adspersus]|uniref:Thaumatin-like protein n=1 Tax=Exocentrus adspersus TaxID=1586481 RepID=A0AAV8VUR7_9CUCU|nr:hypothetical protein NQ315_011476 [Exocentrus adspersus]
MLLKLISYLGLGLVLVKAEVLQIKNNGKEDLVVSVTGEGDFVASPGNVNTLNVPNNFTGTITAVPKHREGVKAPRTTVELTLSPMGDAYDVSLLNGFNVKAKITPLKGRRCKPTGCSADVNSLCSPRNQARDSEGKVVGCHDSPFLFKAVCPKAVVTTADVRNVFTCTTNTYFITLG